MAAKKNNTYSTTHGHASFGTKSRTYKTWVHMLARCKNKKTKEYKNYGDRGITVCQRWESFEYFLEDMGVRPALTTLDRVDVNGNYEPDNCRWATKTEQNQNTRTTLHLTINGERKLIVEWAKIYGIDARKIRTRMWTGFTPEECVSKERLTRRGYKIDGADAQGRFSASATLRQP